MRALRSAMLDRIPALRHAFQGASAPPPEGLVRCHQIHGNEVFELGDEPADSVRAAKADGLLTSGKRPIGVQTADCLPVLIAAADGSVVSAVHAGWRGLHKGILPKAVEKLARRGASPGGLVVAIGPSIRSCCFEVSPEVVDEFARSWGHLWEHKAPWRRSPEREKGGDRRRAPASHHDLWLDLGAIARLQLVSGGIPESRIEDVGVCTYCGPAGFASYRRSTHEGGTAGRQWSWIAISS